VKTHPLTPTCNPTLSTQAETETLTNGVVSFIKRNYSFFQTGTAGFSFGFFALVGAIQFKEVATDKAGSILHHFKIANQFLDRKEYLL